MTKVIAFVNQKGGVGKTTSAITLGHGLAIAGRKVVLVDGDKQGHIERHLNIPKKPGFRRWFYEEEPLEEHLIEARPNLWVLPGDKSTNLVIGKLRDEPLATPMFVKRLRQELEMGNFEVGMIDLGPGLDHLQMAAMMAADYVLIPVSPRFLDMDGVAEVTQTMAELNYSQGKEWRRCIMLPTMYMRMWKESGVRLRELVERFGAMVWPPIPNDPRVVEAPGRGKTLWEYAAETKAVKGIETGEKRIGGYEEALERLKKLLEEG
jgi:chromosome partitioning protein